MPSDSLASFLRVGGLMTMSDIDVCVKQTINKYCTSSSNLYGHFRCPALTSNNNNRIIYCITISVGMSAHVQQYFGNIFV